MATRQTDHMHAWIAEMDTWNQEWLTPIAIASWSGAEPGQQRSCEVRLAAERVEIHVIVHLPDGSGAQGARVHAYNEEAETNRAGEATISVWSGVPQRIAATLVQDLESVSHDDHIGLLTADTTVTVAEGGTVTLQLSAQGPQDLDGAIEDFADRFVSDAEKIATTRL